VRYSAACNMLAIEGRCGAFAFGTGHMHAGESAVRIAERGQQLDHSTAIVTIRGAYRLAGASSKFVKL